MIDFKRELKIFAEKISLEARETKDAAKIIAKYTKGEEITDEEEKALKTQFYDVLKVAGIGIPFAIIPGASIILPMMIVIAKKYDINLMPSSFTDKKENNKYEN